MKEEEFATLEQLNARIDVCIDEEDFRQINNTLVINGGVRKKDLDRCFTQCERQYATHEGAWEAAWRNLLTGRVIQAGEILLTKKRKEKRELIKELWS